MAVVPRSEAADAPGAQRGGAKGDTEGTPRGGVEGGAEAPKWKWPDGNGYVPGVNAEGVPDQVNPPAGKVAAVVTVAAAVGTAATVGEVAAVEAAAAVPV